MRGQKRVEDVRERAYAPRIHLVRKKPFFEVGWIAGSSPAMTALMTAALRVRLALRVDDLLELAEHAHARQQLRQAGVRLAFLLDRGDELAVLELDAVHGDVDLGDVDLVVLAVAEVVVERLVGAVVADVAEERAERPVVVEREREREDRARRHLG